jgi:hypothetical protein
MGKFIYAIHGNPRAWNEVSPSEKQVIMARYQAFTEKMKKESRFVAGSGLKDSSYRLDVRGGRIEVDGPFTESKEALTGYYILEAENMEAALELARSCPSLTHGEWVEVVELSQ